ncbi:MAG: hypothetical protein GXO39_07010 [Thermotogae bacterium]|nr:hypothetical protein [Thermotogota bacterium]
MPFWSLSFGGTVWYADSLKSLAELKADARWRTYSLFLQLRDYRPYSPTSIHGDTYRLNLYRFLLRYNVRDLFISVGDEPLTFGRGLSLYLADDEKALLEASLRGLHIGASLFRLYAGLKRRWIYYRSDGDTLLLAGGYLTPSFGPFNVGLNLSYYILPNRREGRGALSGGYISAALKNVNLHVEGAYRKGYDLFTYGQGDGYAIYSDISLGIGTDGSVGIELKDYYRIGQEFNLPAPANGYGLLPSDGRDERGVGFYFVWGTFNLELTRSYSHDGRFLMKYYALSYYRNIGSFTPKFGAHHMDWSSNLNERVAFLELKYNSMLGVILYGEYRARLLKTEWENQPMFSISLINGGMTVSLSLRRYFVQGKTDRVLEFSWDNFTFLRLFLSYGSFSGDVVCSSGVCRYEPPFTGFKLGLNLYRSF